MASELTIKKSEDVASWYEQIVLKSQIAEFGDVKGTIILRPKGYYMWEQVQKYFERHILPAHQVENAYFPLFIPESYFVREATHAKGFAPELAWVATATSTAEDTGERAILRPTSETAIVAAFGRWLRNYRQLPLKVNQWANVVRWEVKQTKLFLRGREFLWQEGHCAYQTNQECEQESKEMIYEYAKLCKELLALPVIVGQKTENEKFAGATKTFTIEAVMPDGKAVQMGTSHNLGQGFMTAFGVEYKGADEQMHTPYYSSWGVSTRLLGATIMTHSDDLGLILPPLLVKRKVVIIPMSHKNNHDFIMAKCFELAQSLAQFGAYVDDRDQSMGFKLHDSELLGVPLVLIVGGKELETHSVTLKPRDGAKTLVSLDDLTGRITDELDELHLRLFTKAQDLLTSRVERANSLSDFKRIIASGKLALAPFSGEVGDEVHIETTYGVGTRCICLDTPVSDLIELKCIFTGKPAVGYVYFGKSY
jgi:prolyl-tRNA synthetase